MACVSETGLLRFGDVIRKIDLGIDSPETPLWMQLEELSTHFQQSFKSVIDAVACSVWLRAVQSGL
jgi:hypothetical protein